MAMNYDQGALAAMYDTAGALEAKKIAQQYKLGKEEIAARLKIASMDSSTRRYGIDAERETQLAQIAQMRLEMEKIGIPEMEIKRFVAEKTYEVAQAELGLKRDIASGYIGGNPTLEREELARRYGLDVDKLKLDRDRYGLEVAQFGAQLASTPDTYFQARRFQGVDVPRLMGGAGVSTQQPQGAPTPGVATMGSYLSGQDPYGQGGAGAPEGYGGGPTGMMYAGGSPGTVDPGAAQAKAGGLVGGATAAPGYATDGGSPYGGPGVSAQPTATTLAAPGAAPTAPPAADPALAQPGVLGMAGSPEDDRQKQIAAIAKAAPPSPFDGLNDQDAATLRLMEAVYKKNGRGVAGGEMERLAASGRMGFLSSAGRLLGYDPKEFQADYAAYRPQQESSRLG